MMLLWLSSVWLHSFSFFSLVLLYRHYQLLSQPTEAVLVQQQYNYFSKWFHWFILTKNNFLTQMQFLVSEISHQNKKCRRKGNELPIEKEWRTVRIHFLKCHMLCGFVLQSGAEGYNGSCWVKTSVKNRHLFVSNWGMQTLGIHRLQPEITVKVS